MDKPVKAQLAGVVAVVALLVVAFYLIVMLAMPKPIVTSEDVCKPIGRLSASIAYSASLGQPKEEVIYMLTIEGKDEISNLFISITNVAYSIDIKDRQEAILFGVAIYKMCMGADSLDKIVIDPKGVMI